MKTKLQFPKNFKFGAAASAPQTEGAALRDGKSASTWDRWFELEPERFDQHIGPDITSNVYDVYPEDIKRMQAMGLNSYRTSIAWTRLLPDGKTLNQKAVTFYRQYFQALIDANIEPIINLFHFDMPWWAMEQDGWLRAGISDDFAYYARICVENFGDLIKQWVTFNEPIVHVECSYLYGYHYPAIVDFKKAVLCGYHTILAHAKAIKAMRAVRADIEVGVILNLTPVYAATSSVADQKAAKIADMLNITSFLDAMVQGRFAPELVSLLAEHKLLPKTQASDLALIAQHTASFLGVNYYQPRRVQAPQKPIHTPALMPEDLYIPYIWPKRRMNPYRGWEIYPQAILDIATMIQKNYNNMPWYLSENGMGVADEMRFANDEGMIQDDYRIAFIEEHLHYLKLAIDQGAQCYGYHMWTFVDCWSWLNGYRNRYGYYSVDLKTQQRIPKASSFWMRALIASQEV